MFRSLLLLLLGTLVAAPAATAQVPLVPSDRAGYRQKFDLQLADAQFHFLPLAEASFGEGPFRFRFRDAALTEVLDHPSTVRYLTQREGGFHLQIFNLRAGSVPPEALGPQEYEILNAKGEVVAHGTLLVTSRAPEAVDLAREDGSRLFEVGRPAEVALAIRTHRNYAGGLRVVNDRDFELTGLRESPVQDPTDPGTLVLLADLRPLRPEAKELRLALETADGRSVELAFAGLTVQAPAPRRVQVAGGPVFLDALGRGTAQVVLRGFPAGLSGSPEVVPGAELVASEQQYDAAKRELRALLEVPPRSGRAPGTREVREITVRAGAQLYRGYVEVVGGPVVSSVRTDQSASGAVLRIGGGPALLRVVGQNLDELRLDCSSLGRDARCVSRGAGPTELVTEVQLGAAVQEGEVVLPLVATERRGEAGQPPLGGAGVRVRLERGAIPVLLTSRGILRLRCATQKECPVGRTDASTRLREVGVRDLRLAIDETSIPAEHGWQNVVISVTRVRGDQRQVIRSFGSPGAPRTYRSGLPAGELPLVDPTVDLRHGDQVLVRVEHVAEQYPVEYRTGAAVSEPYVARIYVDEGALRRITADIGVQPVLFSFGGGDGSVVPLYPNAGLGFTWQLLNERMEPRPFSVKLQALATNIKNVTSDEASARPAVFLSGNLRIPGSDPNKPLLITGGIARMFGDEPGWEFLLGAGIDFGVARMIFGG